MMLDDRTKNLGILRKYVMMYGVAVMFDDIPGAALSVFDEDGVYTLGLALTDRQVHLAVDMPSGVAEWFWDPDGNLCGDFDPMSCIPKITRAAKFTCGMYSDRVEMCV